MAIDGGSVEVRIEGNAEPLIRTLNEAGEYVDQFGDKWILLEREINGGSTFERWEKDTTTSFQKFSDAAGVAFNKAVDSADDFIGQLKEIGTSLKGVGFGALTAGATAAAGALVKMAKGAVQDTSALENIQIQMIGLTHSTEAGNKAMAMARQELKEEGDK